MLVLGKKGLILSKWIKVVISRLVMQLIILSLFVKFLVITCTVFRKIISLALSTSYVERMNLASWSLGNGYYVKLEKVLLYICYKN